MREISVLNLSRACFLIHDHDTRVCMEKLLQMMSQNCMIDKGMRSGVRDMLASRDEVPRDCSMWVTLNGLVGWVWGRTVKYWVFVEFGFELCILNFENKF